jgi:DNA (cytosine-5)-methyltransferase 1
MQETLSLKTTDKGSRVWLNNKTLSGIGFVAGTKYSAIYLDGRVKIYLDPQGKRTVTKGDIVDLENKSMTTSLPNVDRVHVLYKSGVVVIEAYYHEEKVKRRKTSLKQRIERNLPLRLCDFFAGTGLLCSKIAKGLLAAGISTSLVFANEYDRHAADIYVNSNVEHMATASEDAIVVQDDIFTMNKNLIPEADIMVIGYPCVGFSKQQGSARKMDISHPEAGLLFVPLLESINRANPSIIFLENSDAMIDSDTDFIMNGILTKTGYKFSHTTLIGTEHGDFEPRKRLAKVYYSENLADLDLEELSINRVNTRTLADILEPISLTDKKWKNLSYLSKKNQETSHSHKFIVPSLSSNKLPTFGASYAKIQCDSTIIEHPSNPELHRICTVSEHCNVRNISGEFKAGIVSIAEGTHHLQKGRTNQTKAHSLLGNSVSPTPWFDLGEFIGNWITRQFTTSKKEPLEQKEQGELDFFFQNQVF